MHVAVHLHQPGSAGGWPAGWKPGRRPALSATPAGSESPKAWISHRQANTFAPMSILGASDSAKDFDRGASSFETTQWSIVLDAAQEQDSVRARSALEALCRTYWRPLFSYVRCRGYSSPDAQDLVQGFFARILERKDLQSVRKERGRFRSYLLGALKYFSINEWK